MKIGLSFVGISHGTGRDYNHCFPNINQFLIDPFKKDHDVKIYLTTYSGNHDNLIKLYNPETYQFSDKSHQMLTYIKSLEQLRNQDLDFIISTRFDIHFHQKINEINIDYTKFNALFKEKGWWDSMKFTTDNLFAFPSNMINDFLFVLNSLYQNPSRHLQTDLHQAFSRMQNKIGVDKTHIVSNIDELSNTNLFYSLCNGKWGIQK